MMREPSGVVPAKASVYMDSLELKMEAAQALVQAGIFRPDEPIPLIHEGRPDEAYRLLAGLEEEGVFYPPAMVALANLRRQRGELDDARRTLEALAEAFPGDRPCCSTWPRCICREKISNAPASTRPA